MWQLTLQESVACLGAFGKMSGIDCRRFLSSPHPLPLLLIFRTSSQFHSLCVSFWKLLLCRLQSRTKVLIHLSKTNVFYQLPSSFFADSLTPLSPFSMLKYVPFTLSRGYNIEEGRGSRNVKIGNWKTHAFNETGLFRGVSQTLLSIIVGKGRCSTRMLVYLKLTIWLQDCCEPLHLCLPISQSINQSMKIFLEFDESKNMLI